MSIHTDTPTPLLTPPVASVGTAEQLRALWAMSPAERVAAMWRGELSPRQLSQWTSRARHEVPLIGGELAWIAMHTPEWAEAGETLGRKAT